MKTPFLSPCSRLFLIGQALVLSSVPGEVTSQEDVLVPRDFSRTNSVTLSLVEAKRGNERWQQGIAHAFWEKDGRTTAMTVEGVPCRNLSLTAEGRPKGYFYFALNPSFKHQEVSKVRIEVEYFDGVDGQPGVFGVQYDASATDNAPLPSSKALLPMVPLNGSGKWLKATFHVRDGTFDNAQNARSDFRLVVSPPELSVSRVTVTLEPELASGPVPLKFDAAGGAKLGEWNVQWDSGEKPSFSRGTNSADAKQTLQIRAPGKASAGSWRTTVYLQPGTYEFTGRAKMGDASAASGESGGIMLRASGKGGYRMGSVAQDWAKVAYTFSVTAPEHVELICDFRGRQGTAVFDADSLKLAQVDSPKP